MFRAQTNAFDDAVFKATDENLTSENWEYILVRTTNTLAPKRVVSRIETCYKHFNIRIASLKPGVSCPN